MSKQPILSIIAPVWGVEKYIEEYLSSVYSQDISEDEYEVILVDDCSPDNSIDVIKVFQKAHNNLLLVHHSANKGDNAARNTGFNIASGKYIWFNDPDDVLAHNCLKHIISVCETNNLDCYHWAIIHTNGRIRFQTEDTSVMSGIENMLKYYEITFTWNRVYRRAVLVDNNIRFVEKKGHDVLHTIEATSVCQRMMDTSNCFYYYRNNNPNSETNTSARKAWRQISFNCILGHSVIELSRRLNPLISSLIEESGTWRYNRISKGILLLPFKELNCFYTSFDKLGGGKHIKQDILKKSNRKTQILLKYPLVSYSLNPIYRLLKIIKNHIFS